MMRGFFENQAAIWGGLLIRASRHVNDREPCNASFYGSNYSSNVSPSSSTWTGMVLSSCLSSATKAGFRW